MNMRYFNKLPGYVRSKSGFEWSLFKKLPLAFVIGASIPLAIILAIYFGNQTVSQDQQKVIYQCLGLIFSVWFFVGVAFIGCVIVLIMKGPAYVADPYEIPKENKSLEQYPDL